MAADDEGDSALGGLLSPSKLGSLAMKAKVAGKQAVVPMLQEAIREEVVRLLNQHDPEKLRQYIDVGYPLVEKDLPDGYKNALGNLGPSFENQIMQMVNPETVMGWLDNPEEWMDEDTDPETIADVREVGRIIRTHPGGEEWLARQILAFYEVCNIA